MNLTHIAITINLFIAVIIIFVMFGSFGNLIDLIFDWPLNLTVGISMLYLSGYYIENKMIIRIKKKPSSSFGVGFLGLLIVLLIGVFFGSSVGFLQEGIKYGFKEALIDYYVKPLFWIMFFGIVPTLIVGGVLGMLIRNRVL